jgi:hypothetical protein
MRHFRRIDDSEMTDGKKGRQMQSGACSESAQCAELQEASISRLQELALHTFHNLRPVKFQSLYSNFPYSEDGHHHFYSLHPETTEAAAQQH